MNNMSVRNTRKGFTLIELLVVVLILGILVAVALPSYLSSVKDSRHKTANANAKAIATAVQSLYVKGNGVSYAAVDSGDVATELGGAYPNNPCVTDAGAAGYTITSTASSFSIEANAGDLCDDAALTAITLGG